MHSLHMFGSELMHSGGAIRPPRGFGPPNAASWMLDMPRWMFAFPVVLMILAGLVVFAFTRTGPTDNQNTHAPQTGQTR